MTYPKVKAFFDAATNTVSYVAYDEGTRQAAVIDSVLDFDQPSGSTDTHSAEEIIAYVEETGLRVSYILETHIHADHLSAAPFLKARLGGQIAIGSEIITVQNVFGKVFNEGTDFECDGSQFDILFEEDHTFKVGEIEARVLHTPGHTPACMTYIIGDAAFVGDTIFMPDFGTARTDFPGGSAAQLYHSIQKIFALPDATRIFTAHDYKAPGRHEFAWESTVGEQKAKNIHVKTGSTEAEFVAMRETRDAKLSMPRLILPSLQVNMRAGHMPATEDNGTSYLKLPLNAFKQS